MVCLSFMFIDTFIMLSLCGSIINKIKQDKLNHCYLFYIWIISSSYTSSQALVSLRWGLTTFHTSDKKMEARVSIGQNY